MINALLGYTNYRCWTYLARGAAEGNMATYASTYTAYMNLGGQRVSRACRRALGQRPLYTGLAWVVQAGGFGLCMLSNAWCMHFALSCLCNAGDHVTSETWGCVDDYKGMIRFACHRCTPDSMSLKILLKG